MPSRILHLAAAERLLAALPFRDPLMLRIGSVVPDAEVLRGDPPVKRAHYPVYRDGGARKTFDLRGFREKFGNRLPDDDLALGYYLHLVGDIVQRQMFRNELGWKAVNRESVRLLHRDYALLNPIVIASYGLKREDAVPSPEILSSLSRDPLFSGMTFDFAGFFAGMEHDFSSVPEENDFTVFTPRAADSWISRTASLLESEVRSLRSGCGSVLDEADLEWER